MQALRRGLHLDRTEARRLDKPPDLARIVQGEHLPHEPGDLGIQMPCESLLEDGEGVRCGARNVDEEPSSRLEDAVHLSHRGGFVGEELESELARDDIERLVGRGMASALASCHGIPAEAETDRATSSMPGFM